MCSLSLPPLLTVLRQHSPATTTGPAGPLPAPALRSISRGSSRWQAAPRQMRVRLMLLLPKHICPPGVCDLMFCCTTKHSCSSEFGGCRRLTAA